MLEVGALDDDVHLGHLLHVPELAQFHRGERRLQRTAPAHDDDLTDTARAQ